VDKDYLSVLSKSVNSRAGVPYSFILACDTNNNRLGAYDGSTWYYSNIVDLTPGTHYYVSWTLDSGTLTFYVDGIECGTAAFTYADNSTHNMYVGSWRSSSSSDFEGTIDEMAIFNTVLTEEEINSLMVTTEITDPGLVAHYTFNDGTATDNSANSNDGTLVGATFVDTGKYYLTLEDTSGNDNDAVLYGTIASGYDLVGTGSMEFNGTDSKITGDFSDAVVLGSELSLEAWFKSTGGGGTSPRIIEVSDSSGLFDYSSAIAYDSDGSLRAWVENASGVRSGEVDYSDELYNDNKEHHVAYTYDGFIGRLYVDGELKTSAGDDPYADLADIETFAIGSYYPDSSKTFNGQIDEVAIWSRKLSSSEIKERMHLSISEGTYTNLVAHFSFDDGTAKDNSGNGYDGTISNAVQILSENAIKHKTAIVDFTPYTGTYTSDSFIQYEYSTSGLILDKEFDDKGNLVTEYIITQPSGMVGSIKYDYYDEESSFAGKIKRITEIDDSYIEYSYYEEAVFAGKLATITYDDGSFSDHYYDENSGRLIRVEDSDGTIHDYRYTSGDDRQILSGKVIKLGGTFVTVAEDTSGTYGEYSFRTATREIGSGKIGETITFGQDSYLIIGTGLGDIDLDPVSTPGKHYTFDGTDDRINTGIPVADVKTISMWLNPDVITAGDFLFAGSSSNKGYSIRWKTSSSSQFDFYIGNGSSYVHYYFNHGLTTDKWQYVTFTIDSDNNTFKYFVNGIEKYSTAIIADPDFAPETHILSFSINDNRAYDGKLDELVLFDVPLSSRSICEIMDKGVLGKLENVIAYYPFTDGTLSDVSGNGNDALILAGSPGTGGFYTETISQSVVLEKNEIKYLSDVDVNKLVVEEYKKLEPLTISAAQSTYNISGYGANESIDGDKDLSTNGWSIGSSSALAKAMFTFEKIETLEKIVLTQGAGELDKNMTDFAFYYTEDDMPSVEESMWQKFDALVFSGVDQAYTDLDNIIVNEADQDVYEFTFTPVKAKAVLIKVNSALGEISEFVLNEIEAFGEQFAEVTKEDDILPLEMPAAVVAEQDVYATSVLADGIIEFDLNVDRETQVQDIPEMDVRINSYTISALGQVTEVDTGKSILRMGGDEIIFNGNITLDGITVDTTVLKAAVEHAKAVGYTIVTNDTYRVIDTPYGWEIVEDQIHLFSKCLYLVQYKFRYLT